MQGPCHLAAKQPASRADHLKPYRFKKGQSGNPEGARKRQSFESLVARELDRQMGSGDNKREAREELARRFVKALLSMDDRMMAEFLKREWPATQKVEIDGTVSVEDVNDKRESLEQKGLRVVDGAA